jgi:hypothetical protein
MLEKEPISSIIPPKEIKNIDSVSYYLLSPSVSTQTQWLNYIQSLQMRITSLIHPFKSEESSHSMEITSIESRDEIYKILDQLRIKKSSNKLKRNLPQELFTSSSCHVSTRPTISSEETNYIYDLKKKGLQALVEKLEKHDGYPWNEIKTIRNSILIEQLTDLYQLCQAKHPTSDASIKKILDFAIDLAKTAMAPSLTESYSHSNDVMNYTKHMLGRLIYLTNQNLSAVAKCIQTETPQNALIEIQNEFSVAIQNLSYQLQNYYAIHYETQLQSPELAFHTKIPSFIAEALLTDTGTINLGIIDLLAEKFLISDPPINHQVNLAYGLHLLQYSPQLRNEFEKIRRPSSPNMPSNDVIRAVLGLSPEIEITDLHAKQTILTALLSHIRQGEAGSCFATSLANEILSAHLAFCLKDLTQIIQESKLTRTIKGVCKDIPFIKSIPDEDLTKKISIDRKGYVITHHKTQGPLWEAPGIQAACSSLAIKDVRKAVQALTHSFPFADKSYEIEIKEFIKMLCEYKTTLEPDKKAVIGTLYSQACFAFSAQTAQPLLKVWENAIANMAEAQEGGMIKTNILESILYALQFKLGEMKVPPSKMIKQLLQEIKKNLYARIQLQYDPLVKDSSIDDQQLKAKGGFVLYHKDQRFDNPQKFNLFLAEIIFQISKKAKTLNVTDEELKIINQFFDVLLPYLQSDEFMTRVLVKYHPSNAVQLMVEPHHYNNLKFTPWITRTGNNSKTVLEVYLEANQPIQTEKILSENLEERLNTIIKIGQRLSDVEKDSYLINPNKSSQLRIPGWHTGCLILLGNHALMRAIKRDSSIEEWLEKFIKAPGKQVADSLMDSATRHQLLKQLSQSVLPNFLPKDKLIIFDQLAKELPENLSIKEYRNSLIQLCRKSPDLKPAFILDNMIRKLDTAIYQSLNPELKKHLENSALHLIDTNWCYNVHDIHLCAIVNPGTGELELWEAYSNSSHLTAINQKDWLQEWEILMIPEKLIPNDPVDKEL